MVTLVAPTVLDPTTILSDAMPTAESKVASPGAAPRATREGHTHPRLTSSTYNTVGANGLTTVVFTRFFTKRCGVICSVVESADLGPSDFKVRKYLKNTGTANAPIWVEWTDADAGVAVIDAVELFGYRINPNTPIATFTALTLATFLFTGVNAALNQLVNAVSGRPTTTPIAEGTKFTCIAVASSE